MNSTLQPKPSPKDLLTDTQTKEAITTALKKTHKLGIPEAKLMIELYEHSVEGLDKASVKPIYGNLVGKGLVEQEADKLHLTDAGFAKVQEVIDAF